MTICLGLFLSPLKSSIAHKCVEPNTLVIIETLQCVFIKPLVCIYPKAKNIIRPYLDTLAELSLLAITTYLSLCKIF